MSFPGLLADLVCPLLGIGVLAAPLLRRPTGSRWRFWARTAAGVAWVYLFTVADRSYDWWKSAGMDFSTHTGIAVALAIALACLERRVRPLLAVLLVGYAALMIGLEYHSVLDIATSAAVSAPVALLAQWRRSPGATAAAA